MVWALYFFLFSGFQKPVSQWLGHDFIVFRGSKSDVSAFFWLRFRNGFGTKPAGVLLVRMRVRNTFFLSLAWWLRLIFKTCWGFAFSHALPKQFSGCGFAWFGHYTSFFLVGSKSDVSAFFWLRFRNGFTILLSF